MLVLLSAAYAVGIGGGEVARKLNLRPSQIVPAADTLPDGMSPLRPSSAKATVGTIVKLKRRQRRDTVRPLSTGRRTSH